MGRGEGKGTETYRNIFFVTALRQEGCFDWKKTGREGSFAKSSEADLFCTRKWEGQGFKKQSFATA